jgi:ABC-type cobalamin/Fe3+-siderophores transport system ATPase subunit
MQLDTLPPELPEGGDPSQCEFYINSVELTSGTSFAPPRAGVSAIVGANNVGKSTILREISQQLSWSPGHAILRPILVDRVGTAKLGSEADLCAWLYSNSTWVVRNSNSYGFMSRSQSILKPSQAIHHWTDAGMSDRLGELSRHLVYSGDVQGRMNNVSPVGVSEDDPGLPFTHPIQRMREEPELFDSVATYLRDLFQQELTLDWVTVPGQWRLRIGRPSGPAPPVDRLDAEYLQQLRDLPGLEQQGDGIKSLLGMLIPLTAATYPVVILDEPEAFLHPPQARAFGKILGTIARDRCLQVILATHDRNIIVGLLESSAEVSVVRLTRDRSRTDAHQLHADGLAEVWGDPVLRYSNVLEALFHRAIILCEGDRDCRFYSAAMEARERELGGGRSAPFKVSDILFAPSGGKDGFSKVVDAISAVGTPVVVATDLDIVQDSSKLSSLVVKMGGEWSDMERDYRMAVNQLASPRTAMTNADKLIVLEGILNANPDANYDSQMERLVKDSLRAESPWRAVKRHGLSAFAREARAAMERVVGQLDKFGIVTVREGELEALAPTVTASKGPKWITEAFRTESYSGDLAQAHAERLMSAVERTIRDSSAGDG